MEDQNLMLVDLEGLVKSIRQIVREEVIEVGKTQEEEPGFYDRSQAAKKLGVSVSTIHNWMIKGKLKGKKAGRRVLFSEADLDNCLSSVNKYERL
jgi:excisionase family DNA binding protein